MERLVGFCFLGMVCCLWVCFMGGVGVVIVFILVWGMVVGVVVKGGKELKVFFIVCIRDNVFREVLIKFILVMGERDFFFSLLVVNLLKIFFREGGDFIVLVFMVVCFRIGDICCLG